MQAVLAAADDQAIGLHAVPERRGCLVALVRQVRAALLGAMLDAVGAARTADLLVADELEHRR